MGSKMKLRVKFMKISDLFCTGIEKIKDFFRKLKSKIFKKADTQNSEDNAKKQEEKARRKAERKEKIKKNLNKGVDIIGDGLGKFSSFLRHLIDFVMDLYSFAMLFVCFVFNTASEGVNFAKLKGIQEFLEYVGQRYQTFNLTLIAVSIFFIVKLLVLITARNSRRIEPFMVVSLQILLCFFPLSKFIALLAANFILILLFQCTCKFSKISVRIKFFIYMVLFISGLLLYTYFTK